MPGRPSNPEGPLAQQTPPTGSPAIAQGSVVAGRYEIGRRLGRGGMGVIHLAHDRMLDETVVLKILRHEIAETPGMDERFRSEIRLARKVTHRNVCRIYEYGEDGQIRFISMEWIDGHDLRDQLDSHPEGLPVKQAFSVALQIAEGLEAIHDVGIIHRDLKTPNIMLDKRGRVRLMDFGIAKDTARLGQVGLTQAGVVMGTPEYMSPEQCRAQPLDLRSDIYSLGIVLYEVFTGDVPFQADTPMDTVLLQVQKPLPLDSAEARRIPKPMRAVLSRLLAKRAADRYASVNEAIDAIRKARAETLAEERHTDRNRTPKAWPTVDRREDPRLEIYVNAVVKHLGPDGRTLQQERTIAENISHGGAQVMTSMSGIVAGDTVLFEEIGGEFSTRAEIRNSYLGPDNVHRLNLRFEQRAPDRLVQTDSD
jgi:serine/threonine protein kinase